MADIRIRMIKNVMPLPLLIKAGTVLKAGEEYDAVSNKYGAISGICSNGELLGVKPDEFEFIFAPDWVLDLHQCIIHNA